MIKIDSKFTQLLWCHDHFECSMLFGTKLDCYGTFHVFLLLGFSKKKGKNITHSSIWLEAPIASFAISSKYNHDGNGSMIAHLPRPLQP